MKKAIFTLLCLLPAFTCYADVIIVDANGSGEYPTIQAAIDDSNDGDVVIVAPGTYTGQGNRDIDFNGLAITLRSESGPENCIIDCQGSISDPHRGFSFHNGEDADSAVDGFTITNGYARKGGGIYCYRSSPTITNCTFSGNSADVGGGILCKQSSPTITNCTIGGNSAVVGGGGISCGWNSNPIIISCTISSNSAEWGSGGGISCGWNSNPIITNCTINGNLVERDSGGGGISCRDSSPIITNCTISGNSAEWGGGIFCLWDSSPTITNCTITGNSAETEFEGGGGGISCWDDSSPTITNCTITGNSAECGGGIYCYDGSPVITNCILWDNQAPDGPEIYLEHSNAWINYTNVQDGESGVYVDPACTLNWGPGNIDTDPCFVLPGCWADANDPNIIVEPNAPNAIWIEGDYHLYPLSLCINAGDPNYLPEPNETDLDGSPRVIAGRIDMGAYESNHIEARLWILPRTINRHSRQKRVFTWLRLPEGIAKDDIDSDTPLLLYPGEIEPTRQYIFPRGRRIKRTSIIAYFDKSDLMDVISDNGRVELKIVGRLKTGRYFYGTDTIRIINRPPPPRPWRRR